MVEVILQQWDGVQNDNSDNSSNSNSNDDVTTHSNIFIDEVGRKRLIGLKKTVNAITDYASSFEILVKDFVSS